MIKEFIEEEWSGVQSKIFMARNPYITSILISFLLGGIPILCSIEPINAVTGLGFVLIYSYVLTGYLFAKEIAPYSVLSFLLILKEYLDERFSQWRF
ncbi:MAG: hypothetical protein WC634_01255 [archaeon]